MVQFSFWGVGYIHHHLQADMDPPLNAVILPCSAIWQLQSPYGARASISFRCLIYPPLFFYTFFRTERLQTHQVLRLVCTIPTRNRLSSKAQWPFRGTSEFTMYLTGRGKPHIQSRFNGGYYGKYSSRLSRSHLHHPHSRPFCQTCFSRVQLVFPSIQVLCPPV
jgi:hypothetical protein